jgi:hypothetical protein
VKDLEPSITNCFGEKGAENVTWFIKMQGDGCHAGCGIKRVDAPLKQSDFIRNLCCGLDLRQILSKTVVVFSVVHFCSTLIQSNLDIERQVQHGFLHEIIALLEWYVTKNPS